MDKAAEKDTIFTDFVQKRYDFQGPCAKTFDLVVQNEAKTITEHFK